MSQERDHGIEALKRGDALAAVEHLRRACQLEPSDYRAQLYLGAAYGECQQLQEAVNSLRQAAALKPDAAPVQYNLGVALERAGQPGEAARVLERALALQPDYAKAREALQRVRKAVPGGTAATPSIMAPAAPAPPPSAPAASVAPTATGSEFLLAAVNPVPAASPVANWNDPTASFTETMAAPGWNAAPPSPPVAPWQRGGGYNATPPSQSGASAAQWGVGGQEFAPAAPRSNTGIWIAVGVMGGGLVAMLLLAAFLFPLFSRAREAARTAALRGGGAGSGVGAQTIHDSYGISYTLPAGYPQPQRQEQSVPGALEMKMAMSVSDRGPSACMTMVMLLPEAIFGPMQGEMQKGRFNQTTIEGVQVNEITYQGHYGIEMRGQSDHRGKQAHLRARILLASPRLVMIFYGDTDPAALNGGPAEQFLNSLRINPMPAGIEIPQMPGGFDANRFRPPLPLPGFNSGGSSSPFAGDSSGSPFGSPGGMPDLTSPGRAPGIPPDFSPGGPPSFRGGVPGMPGGIGPGSAPGMGGAPGPPDFASPGAPGGPSFGPRGPRFGSPLGPGDPGGTPFGPGGSGGPLYGPGGVGGGPPIGPGGRGESGFGPGGPGGPPFGPRGPGGPPFGPGSP